MDDAEPGYFPAIDGLRAVAVCAVLLFHAGHLRGGFLGVDAFFVISGFLITGLLLREIDRSGTVRLGEFWARRARRLLPALVLMLCVVTIWSLHFGTATERFALRADSLWGLSFLMNWHEITARHDYWTAFALQSPLTHLWSLAVEEQFYLVWPLVALAVASWARRPHRTMAIICATGAVLSFALMAALYDPAISTRVYEGTDTRVGAMMIGGLFATRPTRQLTWRVLHQSSRSVGTAAGAAAVTLSGGILWMFARADGSAAALFHGGFLAFAAAVGLLLATVTAVSSSTHVHRSMPENALRAVLSLRALRSVGRLSYGLYLWHWPIFLVLSPLRTGLTEWPLLALRLGVTWFVALLSYHLVERPARLGLQRLPRWVTAPAAGFAIGVAAVVAVSVALPQTGAAALDVQLITGATRIAASSQPSPLLDPPTSTPNDSPVTRSQPTISSQPPLPPKRGVVHTIAMFGDSVAETTEPGIAAAFLPSGIALVRGSLAGVGLVNQPGYGEFPHIIDVIAASHPQIVVIQLSTWDAAAGGDRQFAALAALHDIVSAANAQLVILPVPPMRSDQTVAGVDALADAAVRAAATWPDDIEFLDSRIVWGQRYSADLNGDHVPERMWDGVHLCASGAAMVGAWLVGEIAARFDGVTAMPPASWVNGLWLNDPAYNSPPGACAPV